MTTRQRLTDVLLTPTLEEQPQPDGIEPLRRIGALLATRRVDLEAVRHDPEAQAVVQRGRLAALTEELAKVQALADAADTEQKQFAQAYGATKSLESSAAQVTKSSSTPGGR